MDLAERVWARVDKRGPDECWPWIGSLSRGKPILNVDKTTISARKAVWEVVHGVRPPKDRHVESTCTTDTCVNPEHLSYLTVVERFWARVQKTDGCWLWTGRLMTGREYGAFYYRDKKRKVFIMAHRYAWELHNGPIVGHVPGHPEHEICVLHKCDNPPCVRPDHLFLGSDADNIADMISKGRAAFQKERANMQRLCEQAMGVGDDVR